jgi:hypothetical protein
MGSLDEANGWRRHRSRCNATRVSVTDFDLTVIERNWLIIYLWISDVGFLSGNNTIRGVRPFASWNSTSLLKLQSSW